GSGHGALAGEGDPLAEQRYLAVSGAERGLENRVGGLVLLERGLGAPGREQDVAEHAPRDADVLVAFAKQLDAEAQRLARQALGLVELAYEAQLVRERRHAVRDGRVPVAE